MSFHPVQLDLKSFLQFDRLLICGRTGSGKSFLARKFAQLLIENYQVFYFRSYYPPQFPTSKILLPSHYLITERLFDTCQEVDGFQNLISQLTEIFETRNSRTPIAIILDELGVGAFHRSHQNLKDLFLWLNEKDNLELKLIILSQDPAITSADNKPYQKFFGQHDLFGCECLLQQYKNKSKIDLNPEIYNNLLSFLYSFGLLKEWKHCWFYVRDWGRFPPQIFYKIEEKKSSFYSILKLIDSVLSTS